MGDGKVIAPTRFLPSALGLQWGWLESQCRAALPIQAWRKSNLGLEVTVAEGALPPAVTLQFSNNRPHHLSSELSWDAVREAGIAAGCRPNNVYDRSGGINYDYFRALLTAYSHHLGQPNFLMEGEEHLTAFGACTRSTLVVWRLAEAQLELEYTQRSLRTPPRVRLRLWQPEDPQAWRPPREPTEVPRDPATGRRPLFDPRLLLPSVLGIAWDQPRAECQHQLRGEVLEATRVWVVIAPTDPQIPDEVILYFSEEGGLSLIQVYLYESRDFWEGDWDTDEMEAINEEYFQYFAEVERYLTALLGEPDIRADWETEGYEEVALGSAEEVACWDLSEARLLLQLTHEDKELPFFVSLHLLPPGGALPERNTDADR